MTTNSAINGLSKILQICSKNAILDVKNSGNCITNVNYGPLGSLLKRNIFIEWFSSVLSNYEVPIFPLEVQKPKETFFVSYKLEEKIEETYISDTLKYYSESLSLVKNLPFGFAVHGPCVQKRTIDTDANDVREDDVCTSWNLDTWSRVSIIFFCHAKKSMNWFHYWQRQRYHWWRKLSSIPSEFLLSEVGQTASGSQHLSICMEFPWTKESIETISMHGNAFMKDAFKMHPNVTEVPAVVSCDVDLDLAVFAYLSNSHAEKMRHGQMNDVFHLHYKLAPYKVCVSVYGKDTDLLRKLKDVAIHLIRELKKVGISVLPTSDQYTSIESTQYKRYDEMGIVYAIVLNEESLVSGIAALRNRDTTLQEQVHITEISKKLLHYLKMNFLVS